MESQRASSAFSERLFGYRSVEERKLALSLVISLIVMIIEVAGGLLTSSIALISDAGHMFTHCLALAIGLIAIRIARKPTPGNEQWIGSFG